MSNWTNGEHAMELKAERERVRREMSIELADWQASSEAYRRDGEELRAEIERLRALVKELADDLEAEVEGRHYRDTKGYPSELRRYERDIDSVKRARAALEPKP